MGCICSLGSVSAPGEVTNLSFGGARIARCPAEPAAGSDIEITLHRPDHSVTLRAHVFYVEKQDNFYSFGVEFYGSFHERSGKLLPFFREGSEREGKPLSSFPN